MDEDTRSLDPPFRIGYRQGFEDGFSFGARSQHRDDKKDDKDGKGGGDDEGDKKEGAKEDGEHKDENGKKPLYKRPGIVALALAVILLLIIAGIILWRHERKHETTDDAFVDGYTSQLAAQTSGRVVKLYVIDNQHVNKGDPLIDIDSRDNDARQAQARGQLAAAQAQYQQSNAQVLVSKANAEQAEASVRDAEAVWRKAAEDLGRYRQVDPDAVPKQEVDAAVSNERSTRAKLDAARLSARSAQSQIRAAQASTEAAHSQMDAAQANLDAADLQSSYTHVVAPISGRVARRTVDVGNVISTGQALLALVSDTLWVTANYKETQLTYMRTGQPVELVVDAYPQITFHGHVDSIQKATGAYFSSLPAENATGNYVKVVQRVPVKITFDDDAYTHYAIGPGMSVDPNVTVR